MYDIDKNRIHEKCDILEDYAKRILDEVARFRKYDEPDTCLQEMFGRHIGQTYREVFGTDEVADD